ncbi:MAG: hypothetical protein AABX39_00040 [Nanoarchaeota archaeon]
MKDNIIYLPEFNEQAILGNLGKIIFTCSEKEARKLLNFDNFSVIFDFDGTLSRGLDRKELTDVLNQIESKTGKTIDKEDILSNHPSDEKTQKIYSGWGAIEWLLSKESRRECRANFEKYGKDVSEPNANFLALKLATGNVEKYRQEKLKREHIHIAINSIPLRSGWTTVKEYFNELNGEESKIKLAALTYGFKYALSRTEFAGVFDNIYGCELNFKPDGTVQGVSLDVTPITKKDKVEEFGIFCNDAKIIAIGDSMHDKYMFQASDVSVFLAHHLMAKEDNYSSAPNLLELYNMSDVIIPYDTLHPVKDFLELVHHKSF